VIGRLDAYKGTLKKIRIERPYPGATYINGFVHDVSDTLVLIQQFHDFYCEGYTIIRIPDIVNIRSDEYERFFEVIMKGEGLLDLVAYTINVPLFNITSSLSYFSKTKEHIIIECESVTNDNQDRFYLGKVSEIEGTTVWFVEINPLGTFEHEEIGISLEEISRIQFDTPYINIFSKYIGRA